MTPSHHLCTLCHFLPFTFLLRNASLPPQVFVRGRGARDDPASPPAEPPDDSPDSENDCRRLKVSCRAIVAPSHQTPQVKGGQQCRRHQGEMFQRYLDFDIGHTSVVKFSLFSKHQNRFSTEVLTFLNGTIRASETAFELFPLSVLADDPGHGRHPQEEAPRRVPRSHARDARLSRLLGVDHGHAGRHQDVPRVHHGPLSCHEATVRVVPVASRLRLPGSLLRTRIRAVVSQFGVLRTSHHPHSAVGGRGKPRRLAHSCVAVQSQGHLLFVRYVG